MIDDQRFKLCQSKDVPWLSHNVVVNTLRRTDRSVVHSLEYESKERKDGFGVRDILSEVQVCCHPYAFL